MSAAVYVASAFTAVCLWNWLGPNGLRHIPTIGRSVPVLSYLGSFRYIRHAKEMFQEGYSKYKGGIFKIPMPDQWLVVVTGPQLIDELRKFPDDTMSLPRGLEELIAAVHLFGEVVVKDPYHMPLIHSHLSRNLAAMIPQAQDEIFNAFDELIPASGDDWVTVPGLKTMVDIIARGSNRIFVGLPMCRNKEFLDLATSFTMDVSKARFLINLFPRVLKPFVAKVVNTVPKRVQKGLEFLRPFIEERERLRQEHGQDWADKPNDMLMWLMDETNKKGHGIDMVVLYLLIVEFTAIHTTAMSFAHALFQLAANPELAQPLRAEVELVLKEENGWSRSAVSKMKNIDSFLRESQRLNGISATAVWRKTLKPVTFSNGTYIPAGVFVVAAATGTHLDEQNYPTPDVFDPTRFANDNDSTQSFVSTGVDFVPFGVGKHACPGRFFAAFEMKLMLAYILLNYDVKFEAGKEGIRPENKWFGSTIIPDPTVNVMFRKRQI
ncbi:hypothetical protein NLI96_g11343 [Meripilus lineatus]|uniref:Cytochrome P450 n=1 Tax=Meripilus lineatus TaxID=2056292 RepID=A0AAD5UTH7_9APHY|nr:hypothetical protein NLI96_g11343 [Physisporinus lineatus]